MAKGSGSRRRSGRLEQEVLATLWSAGGPLSVAEVRDRLGGDLAETTVRTILGRLHAKRWVSRSKDGSSFRYEAAIDQADVVATEVRNILDLGDDRRAVLQGLLDGLTADDEAVLRSLLEQVDEDEP